MPKSAPQSDADILLELRAEISEKESELRTSQIVTGVFKGLLIGVPSALLTLWVASYFLAAVIDIRPVWTVAGPLGAAGLLTVAIIGMINSDKEGKLLAPRRFQLELDRLYDEQALIFNGEDVDLQLRQQLFRGSMLRDVASIRGRGDRYRFVNNGFQSIIIIGSLATTTVISLSQTEGLLKWLAVGFSLAVGLAAGFTGYFKYRERAFYLRQTADDIEEQLNAHNLGLPPYDVGDSATRLGNLTARVESIRVAQQRREQQLDQPKGSKDEG